MLPRVNLVRTDRADYLLFSTQDAISKTIYANGAWAEPLLMIARMFYQGVAAPVVLVVGANLGGFAVPLAKEIAAAGGVVYAYEPQRIVYYQLCGNAFLNRLDNLLCFNMAVGDHDGQITLPPIDYGNSVNIGGFSLDRQASDTLQPVAMQAQGPGFEVPLRKLDSLSLPGPPALIKVDVEGLELQVLQGAAGYLEQHDFPPLLLEAWNLEWFRERREMLLAHLAALGYQCFAIQEELVAQHPRFARQIQFRTDAAGTIHMARVR